MAVTAREVLLIFRGQNYLSSAIRKVGADVGGLSRGQQLANQRAMLQITGQRLRNTRSSAQAELQSINVGSRRLTQEKAIAAQKLAQMKADSTMLKNQANLSMLSRRVQKGVPLRGFTMDETRKFQQAAQIQVDAQTAAISNQALAVQKLEADEAQLVARRAQLNEIMNTSTRGIDLNTQKLGQNAKAMNMLPFQRFADGATKVEHAGRVIQMFGLITGAAMGYAADQAAKFNTQAVLAATQSTKPGQNTVAQVQKNARFIQQQIQSMLTRGVTTAAPTDLTQGAYNIYSSLTLKGNQRQQLQQGMQILQQFNRVLTANYGMVSFNDVTQAGVTIMNDFGVSVKQLPKALNTMQAAVRYGRMTMQQFLSTFNQAAPAAKSAHYSFDQMSASIAFLSRKFPSVQMAGIGYARLLELLARNAQKFNQAGYQVTNKAGTQLLPLNEIVRNILAKNPQLREGGVNLQNFFKQITGQTGYIQSRRVFTFLAQDLGGYQRMVKNVTGDQNELNKSIKAAQSSPGVKWAEFLNQLKGIVLELGSGAIPTFKAFAAPLEAAIRWFDQLNPRTQKFIGYAAAMAGVGALLGGTLLAVAGGLGRIAAMAAMTIKFMGSGGLVTEAGAVNVRLAVILGTVGLLILVFTRFHKQTMDVVNALGGFKVILGGLAGAAIAKGVLNLASAMYKVRDAELAIDAADPFLLIAAVAGMAAIYVYTHWHTLTRGWEIMVNGMYKFFVDDFINPIIKGIDYFADAWNSTLGHIFGGISKLNKVSNEGPFKILYPDKKFPFNEAYQKAHHYAAGTYGMGMSTKQDPGGFLTPEQLAKRYNLDPFSYGRGASTKENQGGYLKLGSAADRAFRKTKAYLDQVNKATKDNKHFTDQATKAAATYGTTATVSFKKAYKAYVDALAIAKQFPKNINDQIKAQQALSNLESVATKQQIAGAKKAADATVAANKQVATSTQTTFQDVLSNVQSMFSNLQQQEQGIFGQLFQGPFMQSPQMQNFLQFGGIASGRDLMKDLNSQIKQFGHFHSELNRLSKRGAPSALIQQLMQLGPSALPQIEALQGLSQKQLDRYFAMFKHSQNMIQQQTLKDLHKQLAQYRKFGRSVALAIVAGLQDQNSAVTNALKNMIRQAFPGLPGSGHTAATTVTHAHRHRPQHHHMQHRPHDRHTRTRDVHHHYEYNVTAPKDSNVDTQVRHAHFKHRRRRLHGDRYDIG